MVSLHDAVSVCPCILSILSMDMVRKTMYWWYYPSAYIPYYMYDPMAMMMYMMQWMIIPYYYALYMEMFRATLDAWKRTLEAISASITQATKQ